VCVSMTLVVGWKGLTLAPCLARERAVAAPMPLSLDEPVTMAVLPARYCSEDIVMVFLL